MDINTNNIPAQTGMCRHRHIASQKTIALEGQSALTLVNSIQPPQKQVLQIYHPTWGKTSILRFKVA